MAWPSRALMWLTWLMWLLGGLGVWGSVGCKDGGGVTGNAVAGFEARPSALDFGRTALGRPKLLALEVVNSGRAPFHVLGVTPSESSVEVRGFAPFTLVGGEARTFQVAFTPTAEGELHGLLTLDTDSGKGAHPPLALTGVGVRAQVRVATTGIDFGNVPLHTSKRQMLSVYNPSEVEAPLRFSVSGPDADGFSAADAGQTLMLAPGEMRSLSVDFVPSQLGVAQARALLQVCQDCAPVEVPFEGTGIVSTLEVEPGVLDFGLVPVGSLEARTVTLRNLGTEPFEIHGAQLVNNPGAVYQIDHQPPGGLLPPGGTLQLTVSFRPSAMGPVPGGVLALGVVEKGARGPGLKLALRGAGGDSCVRVLPRHLEFGPVAEGVQALKKLEVYNRCDEDVFLLDFTLLTTSGGYFMVSPSATGLPLEANARRSLPVTFTPKPGAEASDAVLSFRVQEGSHFATEHIPLSGTGEKVPMCNYRLAPESLDFGQVQVGEGVALGVGLTNVGTTPCYVSSMGLSSGSDVPYSAEDFPSQRLLPGETSVLSVTFSPDAEGVFNGLAEVWVNHPVKGHAAVPLTGKGVRGCLQLTPSTVDFGRLKRGCPARTRGVSVNNTCNSDLTLSLGFSPEGSASFSLEAPPGGAPVLVAGQTRSFSLRYAPGNSGEDTRDTGAFRVNAGQGPLTVGLMGRAELHPLQTDRFFQSNHEKVDVLFVVDNSGSMAEEQQGLAQNFATFLAWAQARGIDYHIGVTTTGIEESPPSWEPCGGGANGGEAGRLFPVDGQSPRIITPSTPHAAAVFAFNAQVGICHWNEQGLEAAYRALSPPLSVSADDPETPQPLDGNLGFLRADAKLAVVFVSDEDDSSGNTVPFYESFFKGLKGNDPSLLSLSAIVGPVDLLTCPTASNSGTRYLTLAQDTGGAVDSICTADWAASLEKLGRNAFGPQRSFPLSQVPLDPAALSVQVNGVPVAGGWTYDAALQSVVFSPDSVPVAGAIIEISYPLGCG